MDAERINEVYCAEAGCFCNGTMGCLYCPYRDEKSEDAIIGTLI